MKTIIQMLILATALVVAGCQSRTLDPAGPYGSNQALYEADLAITSSYEVTSAFLRFERANRATMPAAAVQFADRLRVEYPKYHSSALALRDAYAAAPTAASHAALKRTLLLLTTAMTEAAKHMTPAQ